MRFPFGEQDDAAKLHVYTGGEERGCDEDEHRLKDEGS